METSLYKIVWTLHFFLMGDVTDVSTFVIFLRGSGIEKDDGSEDLQLQYRFKGGICLESRTLKNDT